MNRTTRVFLCLTLGVLLIAGLVLAGCGPKDTGKVEEVDEQGESGITPAPIKIGTLATQDSLALWVAEEKGHFAEVGLADVEIITFQSAQEIQSAFTAGAVNAVMTDVIVAANLQASGTQVLIPTVMLGADISQGRFAVVGAPGTSFGSMADLKGIPVGSASPTITEYVLDTLMDEAGVVASDVKKEEIKKMPVRYQLLMSGQIKAASLPEPFVSLAEQDGAYVVPGGDDTRAKVNISQTILAVNAEYAGSSGGGAAMAAVLKAMDHAVDDINADPNSFRGTLVEKAGLPAPLASTYQVPTYPKAAPPAPEDLQRVLDWMAAHGYLNAEVTPEELLGL
ncbi:MAG: ABC transporter substrate-binding protein [Coriobacteriia bacterium]|nr:ABC transporter substrate-binding protein [Coriobacteriia bacterium]